MFYKTPNKYGSVRQTVNGYSYMSKLEAKYAFELDLRVKAKDIKSWERQVKVELKGENGSKVCNYFVDFLITHNDGLLEYVEVKGFITDLWKLKWKLFEDKMGKDARYKLTIVT